MNGPRQGRRIVWLVWTLTAVGLIAGVVTVGMIGWMLAKVRVQRARTVVELRGLNRSATEMRALEGEAENETALDGSSPRAAAPDAVPSLVRFVRSELDGRQD